MTKIHKKIQRITRTENVDIEYYQNKVLARRIYL